MIEKSILGALPQIYGRLYPNHDRLPALKDAPEIFPVIVDEIPDGDSHFLFKKQIEHFFSFFWSGKDTENSFVVNFSVVFVKLLAWAKRSVLFPFLCVCIVCK